MSVVSTFTGAIRKHKWWTGGISAAVLLGASALVLQGWNDQPPTSTILRYYYDTNRNALFVAGEDAPPIVTQSQDRGKPPAGVRAYVFSCGRCDVEKERFIGFLHSYQTEKRAKFVEMYRFASSRNEEVPLSAQSELISGDGSIVRRVDESNWFDASSPEGLAIRKDALTRCENPIACDP